MNEFVDDSNFLLYAAKHYDNPQCFDTEEFYDDLKRFKYLKRLFNRYEITGELKERLIINHLIILYNVFGTPAATKLLFVKLTGYYHYLKPFLVLINQLPDTLTNLIERDMIIYTSDITMDTKIIEILRKI